MRGGRARRSYRYGPCLFVYVVGGFAVYTLGMTLALIAAITVQIPGLDMSSFEGDYVNVLLGCMILALFSVPATLLAFFITRMHRQPSVNRAYGCTTLALFLAALLFTIPALFAYSHNGAGAGWSWWVRPVAFLITALVFAAVNYIVLGLLAFPLTSVWGRWCVRRWRGDTVARSADAFV